MPQLKVLGSDAALRRSPQAPHSSLQHQAPPLPHFPTTQRFKSGERETIASEQDRHARI